MPILPQHKQFQQLCKNQFKVVDQNTAIQQLDGLFKRIIKIDQKLDDNRYQVGIRGLLNAEKQTRLDTPLAQNQFQSILSLLQQANDRDMIRIFIFTLQQFLEYIQQNGSVMKPPSPSIQKQLIQLQEKRLLREQGKKNQNQIRKNLLKQSLDAIDALEIKEQSSPQVIVAQSRSSPRSKNNSYSLDKRERYPPIIKQEPKEPIFSNDANKLKKEHLTVIKNETKPINQQMDTNPYTGGFNSPAYLNMTQDYQKQQLLEEQSKVENQSIDEKSLVHEEVIEKEEKNASYEYAPTIQTLSNQYIDINKYDQLSTQEILPSVQPEQEYVYVGQQTASFNENDYKSPKLIEKEVWNKKYQLKQVNDAKYQKFIYNPSQSTIESTKQDSQMDWERVIQIANSKFNPLHSYQELQHKKLQNSMSMGTSIQKQESVITEEMEETAAMLRLNLLKQFDDKDKQDPEKDELTQQLDTLKEFEMRNRNVLMLNCYDNRTEYQILDDLKAKPASPFKTSRYSQNGITLTLIQH